MIDTLLASGLRVAAQIARGFMSPREEWLVKVSWSNGMDVALPARLARLAMKDYLENLGCRYLESDGDFDHFGRGDFGIEQVPTTRDIGWLDIPMIVSTGFEPQRERTDVHLRYGGFKRVRFSKAAAEFFYEHARAEFDEAFSMMARLARVHAERQARDERQERAQEARAEMDAHYAVLGVKATASWAEVQSVYREACKRYHPDSLAGLNLPPHVVELATAKFKTMTDAYHAIKAHYAA